MIVIRATQETKKIATSEQKKSFWSWLFSK
ncbi:DUF3967 domain-containing protein [Bacillus sp. S13(2024)]